MERKGKEPFAKDKQAELDRLRVEHARTRAG